MIVDENGGLITSLFFTTEPGGERFAVVRADPSAFARSLSASVPGSDADIFARLSESDAFQNIETTPLTIPASGGLTVIYLKVTADGGAAFSSIVAEMTLI